MIRPLTKAQMKECRSATCPTSSSSSDADTIVPRIRISGGADPADKPPGGEMVKSLIAGVMVVALLGGCESGGDSSAAPEARSTHKPLKDPCSVFPQGRLQPDGRLVMPMDSVRRAYRLSIHDSPRVRTALRAILDYLKGRRDTVLALHDS